MSDDAGHVLARIQKWNVVVVLLATAWAAWKFGPPMAVAVALGGGLGTANFWLTSLIIRRTFVPDEQSAAKGGGLVTLKFLMLFGLIGLVLVTLRPNAMGFGLGFCSILVAIVASTVADLALGKKDDEEGSEPR